VRLAIKDLFDVKGVKTSGQNRAYARLYPEADETAHFLQKLLDLGAVIVGKTKCTQFGSSEQPTADWIETHCPWNPRGDGYLSPRGSSTGSGVAIAAYDWVDVGIGTDSKS
jgi:Asp-tRNA(Asn)/Glu-tRNA(Gln) amidotransferase A subunit family amidase